jgi:hypothetical protein
MEKSFFDTSRWRAPFWVWVAIFIITICCMILKTKPYYDKNSQLNENLLSVIVSIVWGAAIYMLCENDRVDIAWWVLLFPYLVVLVVLIVYLITYRKVYF